MWSKWQLKTSDPIYFTTTTKYDNAFDCYQLIRYSDRLDINKEHCCTYQSSLRGKLL